ncbi:MarR family winged helix-turn-helix transcriptional regulator [Trujillonella humicola]|uniref:MarR family winged helix-turn-helix transcriptional regulator n=1 Tax=Trujillonella humicola TaxID=3383699 RepID=UPI0039057C48
MELASTPGHLIRRAQRVHSALWSRLVGREPTGPQFAVLSSIAAQPGLDQTTVGALASLDKASTTDVVRRLVRHGWIIAEPDPADLRRRVLHLSRPARAALEALTERAAAVQSALLAPLDPGQAARLVRDLATLAYEGRPPTEQQRTGDLGLRLSTTPGHLIRRAQQAYTVRWTQRFQGALTGPQYAVLCALAQNQPSDQSTLGEEAFLDKSSIAEVVDRLVTRGLVAAVANDADRRRKVLVLADAGREALPAMTEGAAAVQAELMDLLPRSAHTGFLEALAAVAYQDMDASPADRLAGD